jgi:acetolactate synthase I/II/III large subunit
MPSVADAIVRQLLDAGVGCLFGMPGGGSNLDLIAAAGRAGLPFVLTATESAGAIAAIAQAEITGRPGACVTTLGPGVASVVNGVACAALDRAPLLVFTDAHPAAAASFTHQRVDHQALLAPVVKASVTMTGGPFDATVAGAIALAMEHPRGPVHVECPADALSAEVPSDRRVKNAQPFEERAADRGLSDPTHQTTRDLIASARHPLLIVGLAACDAAAAAAVRELCATRRVPALVTYKAKGVIPDADPHFAGVFTNGAFESPVVASADLLIGVGLDPVELLPRPWPYRQPIVNIAPYAMACDHVPFVDQFVGDVADGVRHLIDIVAAGDRAREPIMRDLFRASDVLTPDRVVRVVAEACPAARVTVDAGAHMFPATILWPVGEPRGMLISNGLSTMGFALPAAIGAACLNRGKADTGRNATPRPGGPDVVALIGDGGLLMCAGELQTAARERLPILVVVFNDGRLSLIDVKQRQRNHPESGVTLGRVRWCALAQSMGVASHLAASEDQLRQALAAVRRGDGPSLIEAVVDPGTYGEILRTIRG